MLISCPSCSTSYDVDPAGLGEQGKTVRCSNCGHKWHQVPVAAAPPPPPAYAPPPPAYAPPPPYYGPPVPPQYQQPYYPPPYGAPPPGYGPPPGQAPPAVPSAPPQAEPPQPEPAVAAPTPEPAPPPLPEPEPEEIDPEDLPTDEELDAMLGPEIEPESGSLAPDLDEEITEIDEDALEALEDPEPLPNFGPEEEEDHNEDIDPEDIPDPDPIPSSFSSDAEFDGDAQDEKGGRGKLFWILVGTGGFVLLLLILIFAAPRMMSVIPGLGSLYSAIGMDYEDLGAGLTIDVLKQDRQVVGDREEFSITGSVENVSDKVRPVPIIRVILSDVNDRQVQFLDVMPPKRQLPPREKITFTGVVKNLIPVARKVDVGWSESEELMNSPEEPVAGKAAPESK